MAARISQIATISNNPANVGTMYETIFGLNFDPSPKPLEYGEVLTDGRVALHLHRRLPGHRLGLHHFGIEVDDIEAVLDKIKAGYPGIGWANRPPECPYAGVLSHDPAGSIFALSESASSDVDDATLERAKPANFERWSKADFAGRILHHYAIRTRDLAECADFYEDVFGFRRSGGKGDDPNQYLTDGNMTLMLIPWSIQDYAGISVTGRGPDHIGFKVEDAAVVVDEIERYCSHYAPGRAPLWLFNQVNRDSQESQTMDAILDRTCPMSSYHFTDMDGVFIVVGDKTFSDLYVPGPGIR